MSCHKARAPPREANQTSTPNLPVLFPQSVNHKDQTFLQLIIIASFNFDLYENSDWIQTVTIIGPIPWGHSGPLCHALSLSSSLWTSMRRRRATVQWRHLVNWREAAHCGEWAQHFSNASCYVYSQSSVKSNDVTSTQVS